MSAVPVFANSPELLVSEGDEFGNASLRRNVDCQIRLPEIVCRRHQPLGVQIGQHDLIPARYESTSDREADAAGGARDDGTHQRCFLSSWRASEFLCTSSGPSANRSVRMPAYISASGKS